MTMTQRLDVALYCVGTRANLVDRVQKLKDARSEAAKEIEEYKAKKEAEYKKFESEVSHHLRITLLLARRGWIRAELVMGDA